MDQIFEVCGIRGEFLEYAKTQNYRKLPVWYGPDKDARRITEVLCLIGMAWRKYSDMRFVQMLFKVCCTEKIFDIDDGVLVELLKKNL